MSDFRLQEQLGFTLVEVLMAVAIAGILMTGVFAAFQSQQDSYLAQEQIIELQQSMRASLEVMVREIRMSGFDPTEDAGAEILTATDGRFSFTTDNNSDGDTADSGETITYGFASAVDSEPDGIVDSVTPGATIAALGREIDTTVGFEDVAENIQAIEFTYYDGDGAVTATLDDIRSVEISILARARQRDKSYIDGNTYATAGGSTWGPFNDSYRRRFQRVVVQCRNMGL